MKIYPFDDINVFYIKKKNTVLNKYSKRKTNIKSLELDETEERENLS